MENPSFHREKTKQTIDLAKLPKVEGLQLDKALSVQELIKQYKKLGFQASNLGKATEVIARMQKNRAAVFLAYTSNMISSGLREIIAQLVKHNLVAGIITSTGAIEEDIMKCTDQFYVGDFEADDVEIKENALNRIGNIYVPDKHYCTFEDFHMDFLEKTYAEKKIMAPSEYIRRLGLLLQDEQSVLYWAAKNDIPIYCPGFVDGAMGDHFYFFNQKHKDEPFIIDTTADVTSFYNLIMQPEKIAGVILGGGIAKHHLIGAAIIRDGLDYAVYIQTGTQYDGSLSGAQPKEAVSWNKLKEEENAVVVEGDATLIFPLIAHAWLHP